MPPAEPGDDFDALVVAHLDGNADAAQAAALAAALSASPAALDRFIVVARRDERLRRVFLESKGGVQPGPNAGALRSSARNPSARRPRPFPARVPLAALVLLALGVGAWLALPDPGSDPVIATLASCRSAERWHGEEGAPARDGAVLADGDVIATGAGGAATVVWSDGTTVTLGAASWVRVAQRGGKHLDLRFGSLRAEVVAQPVGRPLVAETAHARATVVGTAFELEADAQRTRLAVRSGAVRFARLDGADERLVSAGEDAVFAASPPAQPVTAALDADADDTSVAYDAPIVISAGGTYRGNWRSDDDDVPAVRIATRDPVIIERSRLAGSGRLIATDFAVGDLTVRDCTFRGRAPKDPTRARGEAIVGWGFRNLVVEHNDFIGTGTAVNADEYSGDGTPGNTLIVRRNRARDLDGAIAAGGRQDVSFVRVVNFRQAIGNPRGAEIAWNEVVNRPGASCTECLILLWLAGGRPDSWLSVHDNCLYGSYYPDPRTAKSTGSGVTLVGPDSERTAFIEVRDNVILNTTNAGITVAAGSNVRVHGNRIISTGRMPDGTPMPGSFVGLQVADLERDNPERVGSMHDISIVDNVLGWAHPHEAVPHPRRHDALFRDGAGDVNGPNQHLPDAPITQAMQDDEHAHFLERARSAGVVIGPRPAPSGR